jgi:four helix bundle protein
MPITSYRDLDAWRLGMDLVEAVYHVTKQFPAEERFGLSAQLRRSAVGIPSNVSEGHQLGTRSYRRFVAIALGCVAECETQLELAHRLETRRQEGTEACLRNYLCASPPRCD